ncbi:ureidoglycolate lyase [Leucobacter sp. CSA1]|uniref:Ureidoglycolate lyase n=1 Tax=Leucobacter chromiisoli TaxID=2796471 RepID=A0A934Q6Q4_9MICO|nr:ureidoglycolate lyase [Leucobacter chromiisoli]MBK0418703.1 ureidoglycolate lyase [Leucobacter chromiisoli]
MSAARSVSATIPDAESFAPYGRVHVLDAGEGPGLVLTEGDGWVDAYTRDPLTREVPSLGMTRAPGMPFASARMERHRNVEEALVPAGSPLVLAVAEPTGTAAPRAENVRAFVIPCGTVVVLDPGVWHDACRGLDGPTGYFWLASCVDSGSSPWTAIEGGPVAVRVDS